MLLGLIAFDLWHFKLPSCTLHVRVRLDCAMVACQALVTPDFKPSGLVVKSFHRCLQKVIVMPECCLVQICCQAVKRAAAGSW